MDAVWQKLVDTFMSKTSTSNFKQMVAWLFRSLRSPKLNFPTFDSELMADHNVMRQRDSPVPGNSPQKEAGKAPVNGTNGGATSDGECQPPIKKQLFHV